MRISAWWSVGVVVLVVATCCQVDSGYSFDDGASAGAAGDGESTSGGGGRSGGSSSGGRGGGTGAVPSTGGRTGGSAGSVNPPEEGGSAGVSATRGGSATTGGTSSDTTGGVEPQGQGGTSDPQGTGGVEPQGEGGTVEPQGNGGEAGTPLPSQPGATCSADAECESDVCFDGVCCDEVCDDPCYGCTRSKTNYANGRCAPVIAGTDPYNSCGQSGDACGLDGQCDGSGECRYAGASTVCAAASCVGGQLTAASKCSGDGQCDTPAATSCGNYVCADSLTCRTACSQNAHCSSTTYCKNSSCVDKEDDGTLCTAAAQCQSGSCSGRCCPSGTPCNCPQPNAANVLKNPGFDTNLSNWNLGVGFAWNSADASQPDATAQCPFSGSVVASITDLPFDQCAGIQANTFYDFGVRIRMQGDASSARCNIILYAQANCTGSSIVVDSAEVTSTSSAFTADLSRSFNSGDHVSADIVCFMFAPGSATTNFDRFYLSKAPATF